MSDTAWRDTYGDANTLANCIEGRRFAEDRIHAATALREQAERIAALGAENEQLVRLVLAVGSDFSGVYAGDVAGVNWFDARADALEQRAQAEGEG